MICHLYVLSKQMPENEIEHLRLGDTRTESKGRTRGPMLRDHGDGDQKELRVFASSFRSIFIERYDLPRSLSPASGEITSCKGEAGARRECQARSGMSRRAGVRRRVK